MHDVADKNGSSFSDCFVSELLKGFEDMANLAKKEMVASANDDPTVPAGHACFEAQRKVLSMIVVCNTTCCCAVLCCAVLCCAVLCCALLFAQLVFMHELSDLRNQWCNLNTQAGT